MRWVILALYDPDPGGSFAQRQQTIAAFVFLILLLVPIGVVLWMRKRNGGPGRYKVRGVRRASREDTEWACDADSAENAKAKGELEGISVTKVEKVTSKGSAC